MKLYYNMLKNFNKLNKYQSSEIDWCENNYQLSIYICEFMNTTTSFSYIYIAFFGYTFFPKTYLNKITCKITRHKYLKLRNYYNKIYLILVFIGIFTYEFHLKLSIFGQIFDELSIIILLLLLNLNYNIEINKIILIIGLSCIIFINPKNNRYFLLIIGIAKWLELYKTTKYNNSIILKQLFKKGCYFNIIALFFWSIDICLCDYLYLSTHFLWHIFSALTLHYYIIYTLWYSISNISNKTKFEDDDRYIIFNYNKKYLLYYTYNIEYYYGLPYIYYRCNII